MLSTSVPISSANSSRFGFTRKASRHAMAQQLPEASRITRTPAARTRAIRRVKVGGSAGRPTAGQHHHLRPPEPAGDFALQVRGLGGGDVRPWLVYLRVHPLLRVDDLNAGARFAGNADEIGEDAGALQLADDEVAGVSTDEPGGDHLAAQDGADTRHVDALAAGGGEGDAGLVDGLWVEALDDVGLVDGGVGVTVTIMVAERLRPRAGGILPNVRLMLTGSAACRVLRCISQRIWRATP